jgi:hypothetical protein
MDKWLTSYLTEHLCCVLLTHATRCMHIVLHALNVGEHACGVGVD